jgi:hypothetical protein
MLSSSDSISSSKASGNAHIAYDIKEFGVDAKKNFYNRVSIQHVRQCCAFRCSRITALQAGPSSSLDENVLDQKGH